jgi:hypothetical protein
MSAIVIELLRKAIDETRSHLARLESELVDQEIAMERSQSASGRLGRASRRKRRGLRNGSIPQIAESILRDGQLSGIALAEKVSQKTGKEINVRDLGIGLGRYIRKGIVFQKTEEGLYALKK